METLWFVLVAFMLTGYVVLDGFDLGAGALHLIAARNEDERRLILRSIGPVWDGNEVWLLAAGGTLFYAFPLVYASSFSGFYLPLNMVLWLLVFRALGIEFRAHVPNALWRDFFDGVFSLSSILLIVFFGVAFGNVIRGVPLEANHYFFVSLWTDFQPGANPGAIDWYTILAALVAVVALSLHGALYLILKTDGPLNGRLRRIALWGIPALAILTMVSLVATLAIRPQLAANYRGCAAGWLIPFLVVGALAAMFHFTRSRNERDAFLSSCLYITAMLAGAAYALYPALLPSTTDNANTLTIFNSAAGPHSLSIGVWWWGAGMMIAIGYFVLVYSMFRGKVGGGKLT